MSLLLAQQPATELHGFLPTRGSWMLDFVFLAMFAIVPILTWSIWLVKYRRPGQDHKCEWHKRIQVTLALVLLVAVTAFEVDLNLITKDWRPLAEASPFYASRMVDYSLWIHLCFAVPTPLLWGFVIVQALRKFPSPARPCEYSPRHALWGKIAAIAMFLTAATGWLFYCLAFVS